MPIVSLQLVKRASRACAGGAAGNPAGDGGRSDRPGRDKDGCENGDACCHESSIAQSAGRPDKGRAGPDSPDASRAGAARI